MRPNPNDAVLGNQIQSIVCLLALYLLELLFKYNPVQLELLTSKGEDVVWMRFSLVILIFFN